MKQKSNSILGLPDLDTIIPNGLIDWAKNPTTSIDRVAAPRTGDDSGIWGDIAGWIIRQKE